MAYEHEANQISFFPADGESHVRCYSSGANLSTRQVLQIPTRGLGTGNDYFQEMSPKGHRGFVARNDSALRQSMLQLYNSAGSGLTNDIGSEIAAYQVLWQLAKYQGVKRPDWQRDVGAFTSAVMKQLTEYVDSHLSSPFCLADISAIIGCSPSHFARKFHRSAGMSLGRFINRRRLAAAMVMLRDDSMTLSQIAFSLGFSSQSHFTRVFSEMVGIPPMKFRKLGRPSVG